MLPNDSVDSIVTDPPYGLGFMGKAWDALPPGQGWATDAYSSKNRQAGSSVKHVWILLGGGGGWEIWQCKTCRRKAIPAIFGFMWPFPRCHS